VSPKFRWDVTLTTARQYSKVIDLYEGINEQLIDGINNAVRVVGKVGQPLGDIYMYDYARDPDGNKIVNTNGSYSLNASNYVKVGNVNPKALGGLYSDFFMKDSISILVSIINMRIRILLFQSIPGGEWGS
jgi:iron complex outermembrane receptor protein